MREADILYEEGDYWVRKTTKAFEVYKNGRTCAYRIASIGLSLGLDRAKAEITRRIGRDALELP